MKRNPMKRMREMVTNADMAYEDKLMQVQDALVRLLGQNPTATSARTLPPPGPEAQNMRGRAARMASSDEALMAMKIGLPIAAAVAPAIEIGNNESYANQAMDLLAMGGVAGGTAYGFHNRGRVGKSTAALPRYAAIGGAGAAGLLASDVIQSLLGGGEG